MLRGRDGRYKGDVLNGSKLALDPVRIHVGLALLLPELHRLDLHGGLGPAGVPVVHGRPEVQVGRAVHAAQVLPGLAPRARREVPVGAPDGHARDEVEVLVKGGVLAAARPGVLPVAKVVRVEGVRLKGDLHHAVGVRVHVSVHLFLVPVQPKGVEAGGEVAVGEILALAELPVLVVAPVRAKVHAGRDGIVATWRVAGVVAAAVQQVDGARGRPLAVGVGGRPEGQVGVQPVPAGQLRPHLQPPVLEPEGVHSADPRGLDRRDHHLPQHIGATRAPERLVTGAKISWGRARKVHHKGSIGAHDGGVSNISRGKSRVQIQDTILNVRVGSIVGVVLELPILVPSHSDLMLPDIQVEGIKLFLKNENLARSHLGATGRKKVERGRGVRCCVSSAVWCCAGNGS
mmetsp:Transcript_2297/g.3885  ORF Transcript_2297/g.3885 Transcript_2297/m.3885 type:complete len:402 (+) Transcript_2297:575-1780(+)